MQNKGLMGDILNTIETKQLCMILEWVKGHETIMEDKHNWVSRLKMQAADREEKMAAEEEQTDTEFQQ